MVSSALSLPRLSPPAPQRARNQHTEPVGAHAQVAFITRSASNEFEIQSGIADDQHVSLAIPITRITVALGGN